MNHYCCFTSILIKMNLQNHLMLILEIIVVNISINILYYLSLFVILQNLSKIDVAIYKLQLEIYHFFSFCLQIMIIVAFSHINSIQLSYTNNKYSSSLVYLLIYLLNLFCILYEIKFVDILSNNYLVSSLQYHRIFTCFQYYH